MKFKLCFLLRWLAERLCPIGEISRELDTSKGGSNPEATLPSGGKSKTETLK